MKFDPVSLFNYYRMATGVYLFSKKERLAWDLTFLILIFIFLIGLVQLTVGTYHSFIRVFFGNLNAQPQAAVQN